MDIEFESLDELYKRIKPALQTKRGEILRRNIDYIKEEDIWNYLISSKWSNSKNLSLYQMVNDILNCDYIKIDRYIKNQMKNKARNLYFEGGYDEK